MHLLATIFFYHLHRFDWSWLISIEEMPIESCGFIWAHPRLNLVKLFQAHIVLPIIFSGIMILFDEPFEMLNICFVLPGASLHIPVEPFDQIVCFTSLLLHIEDFLDCVIVFICILDLFFIFLLFVSWSSLPHGLYSTNKSKHTYQYQKYSLIKVVILLNIPPLLPFPYSSSSESYDFLMRAFLVFWACSLKSLSLNSR